MPVNANLDLTSAEDIIGREPAWIVRVGISLIAVILLLLACLSWFIRYPDSVAGTAVLQTLHSSVQHRSHVSGHIEQMLVADGQQVEKNQPLSVIGGELNFSDLSRLEATLSIYGADPQEHRLDHLYDALSTLSGLGVLQTHFEGYKNSLREQIQYHDSSVLKLKIRTLNDKVQRNQAMLIALEQKKATAEKQMALEQQEAEQKTYLADNGLATSSELIQAKQRLYQKMQALNDIGLQIKQRQMDISQYQLEIENQTLLWQRTLQEAKSASAAHRAELMTQLGRWKKDHVILAKVNGEVSFNQAWKANQYIQDNQTLFTVIPDNQKMDAWMRLSGAGIGKVKVGQKVDIELDQFPAGEFGKLSAKVEGISLVPDEEGYLIRLTLPEQIRLSHGGSLEGIPYMQGKAKIITRKRRLLQRITDKLLFSIN